MFFFSLYLVFLSLSLPLSMKTFPACLFCHSPLRTSSRQRLFNCAHLSCAHLSDHHHYHRLSCTVHRFDHNPNNLFSSPAAFIFHSRFLLLLQVVQTNRVTIIVVSLSFSISLLYSSSSIVSNNFRLSFHFTLSLVIRHIFLLPLLPFPSLPLSNSFLFSLTSCSTFFFTRLLWRPIFISSFCLSNLILSFINPFTSGSPLLLFWFLPFLHFLSVLKWQMFIVNACAIRSGALLFKTRSIRRPDLFSFFFFYLFKSDLCFIWNHNCSVYKLHFFVYRSLSYSFLSLFIGLIYLFINLNHHHLFISISCRCTISNHLSSHSNVHLAFT